jgi:hypothetical protein
MHTIARKLRYCSKLMIFQPAEPKTKKKRREEKKRERGDKKLNFQLAVYLNRREDNTGSQLEFSNKKV